MRKHKKFQLAKAILNNNNNKIHTVLELTLNLIFKMYFRSTVTKIAWFCLKTEI